MGIHGRTNVHYFHAMSIILPAPLEYRVRQDCLSFTTNEQLESTLLKVAIVEVTEIAMWVASFCDTCREADT